VGRDTPSYAQRLRDALREDPDVILVGELRAREAVQLTLDAAETGHLVLATVHAADPVEALQRVVAAFPTGEQESARAQLASALRAVVCQRLAWRAEVGLRVPECEVLVGTRAVAHLVRSGDLYKLRGVLETGAADGMWTLERWRRWLDGRTDWARPEGVEPNGLPVESAFGEAEEAPAAEAAESPAAPESAGAAGDAASAGAGGDGAEDDVIVLQPPDESIEDILSDL
jgi:twitching motility protein PilT